MSPVNWKTRVLPFQAQWSEMVVLQSVQGRTGLTHRFESFDIRALWRSGLSAGVPECQKIKNGGLDQYGAKRLGRLTFATIRKSVGLKGLRKYSLKASTSFAHHIHSVHFRTTC